MSATVYYWFRWREITKKFKFIIFFQVDRIDRKYTFLSKFENRNDFHRKFKIVNRNFVHPWSLKRDYKFAFLGLWWIFSGKSLPRFEYKFLIFCFKDNQLTSDPWLLIRRLLEGKDSVDPIICVTLFVKLGSYYSLNLDTDPNFQARLDPNRSGPTKAGLGPL